MLWDDAADNMFRNDWHFNLFYRETHTHTEKSFRYLYSHYRSSNIHPKSKSKLNGSAGLITFSKRQCVMSRGSLFTNFSITYDANTILLRTPASVWHSIRHTTLTHLRDYNFPQSKHAHRISCIQKKIDCER